MKNIITKIQKSPGLISFIVILTFIFGPNILLGPLLLTSSPIYSSLFSYLIHPNIQSIIILVFLIGTWTITTIFIKQFYSKNRLSQNISSLIIAIFFALVIASPIRENRFNFNIVIFFAVTIFLIYIILGLISDVLVAKMKLNFQLTIILLLICAFFVIAKNFLVIKESCISTAQIRAISARNYKDFLFNFQCDYSSYYKTPFGGEPF